MIPDPDPNEAFYAQALATLSGPRRRTAMLMRGCSVVYWTLMITAMAWLAWQAFDRHVPIDGRRQTLLTPAVAPGEPIRVEYELTRRRVCATDVSWTEIDGAGEVHRFGPSHIAAPGNKGPDHFTYAWRTSPAAAPGPSVLRVALEYRCPGNYLHALYPIAEVLPDIIYETGQSPLRGPRPPLADVR